MLFSPNQVKMSSVFLVFFIISIVSASPNSFVGCGTNCGIHNQDIIDHPGIQNCQEYFYKQTVDHFSYALPTGGSYYFQQR